MAAAEEQVELAPSLPTPTSPSPLQSPSPRKLVYHCAARVHEVEFHAAVAGPRKPKYLINKIARGHRPQHLMKVVVDVAGAQQAEAVLLRAVQRAP